METKRLLWNKKSILLFLLFFVVNTGLFYYQFIQDFEPRFEDELCYVDYTGKLEEIEKQIAEFKEIPIFQNQDREKEEQKMLDDYGKLTSVRGMTHRADGISLWFADSISHYITLLFCIWFVFLTFDTEKRGLFPLVYAAKRGRLPLAFCHLRCYFLAAFGGSVLFQWSLLTIACIRTENVSALWQPIQYVPALERCILPLNGVMFVLRATAVSACGIFAVVLLFWMFLLMMHNSKIALTVFGILFAAEYFLHQWIPAQSQWSMLKYINIMTLLDGNALYQEYRLYKVGSICLERMEWVSIAIILFSVLLSAVCLILASKRRPYYQKNLLERAAQYALCRIRKALCVMPGCLWEWYKMFVPQRGLFIFVFFLAVLTREVWQPMSAGQEIMIGSTGQYMADFYAQWEGPVTEEVYEDVADRERELEMLIESDSPVAGYYANGLRKVHERLAYIEQNEEKGLWLVNPAGYECVLGKKGETDNAVAAVLVLFCLAVLIAGVFTFEKKSGTEFLQQSTPRGRKRLRRRKYRMIIIVTVVLWLVLNGMELYHVLQTYPLGGFGAPVQSLPFMKRFPFAITIWQYCLFVYGIRLACFLIAALLYAAAAAYCYSQEIAVLLCSITLFPSILYWMGVDAVSYLAITKIMHVSHFFRQGMAGIWKETAAIVLAVLVIRSWQQSRRKRYA